MARNVMEQLVKTGKVTRAYLGIVPQDVTPAIAKAFGEKDARGALVGDVSANSPAQKSGIEKGDIILDVNGKPVADSNELRMTISMMQPDANVNLRISRNGADTRSRRAIGRTAHHHSVGQAKRGERKQRALRRLRGKSGRAVGRGI